MAQADRERWDARYAAGRRARGRPSPALVELVAWLPSRGRALDVAGGAGANAVWLAQRGLSVTVADISPVGLDRARDHARHEGVELEGVALDLEVAPLPAGPWALAICCHYLQRELIPRLGDALGSGGRLVWIHPTVDNLERHDRPSARWLLAAGEARQRIEQAGLRVLHAEEGWVGDGDAAQCLARVVAERG